MEVLVWCYVVLVLLVTVMAFPVDYDVSSETTKAGTEKSLAEEDDIAACKRFVFSLFDVNRDGELTPEELQTLMGRTGFNHSITEMQKLVNDTDTNGNGALDISEFYTQLIGSDEAEDEETSLRVAFDIFDQDDDHLVSADELRTRLYSENGAALEKVVKHFDFDGDGKWNFKEFVAVLNFPLSSDHLIVPINYTPIYLNIFLKIFSILACIVNLIVMYWVLYKLCLQKLEQQRLNYR